MGLCGIGRDTCECFAVLVERRDAATPLPIIHQYIRPGTTIYSDQWAAYNNIANGPHQYIHQTVNHSQNFVDPNTLKHTQNVEKMWICMKTKKKLKWVNMFLFSILIWSNLCGVDVLETNHLRILFVLFKKSILYNCFF